MTSRRNKKVFFPDADNLSRSMQLLTLPPLFVGEGGGGERG